MPANRVLITVLLIVTPLLEIVLKTSNIDFLASLKIVYIVTLGILLAENSRGGIIYLFVGSIFIELILLQTVGLSALVFLFAWVVTSLIFKFITILSEDSFNLRAIITIVLSLVFKHVSLILMNKQSSLLGFSSLLVNLIFLGIVIWLTSVLVNRRNVYSKFRTI